MSIKDIHIPEYQPEYWSPDQVIAHYQEHDTALPSRTLNQHLLNLVGTSFLKTTVTGINYMLELQKQHPELKILHNPIDASTLFHSMLGVSGEDFGLAPVEDPKIKWEAKAALASALGVPYFPRAIRYNHMRPDEMVFELLRHDDLYLEGADSNKSYVHISRQAFFFQKGLLVDAIGLSSVFYHLPNGFGRIHSLLSEGLHELPYFITPEKKPLPFVDPKTQHFSLDRSESVLDIGRNFTYSQARYKRPDRRGLQPGYMPEIMGLIRRHIRGK